MSRKNNALLLVILICMLAGLVASLAPSCFIENQSLFDSSVTEDLLLIPVLLTITGLLLLLTRLCSAYFATPQLFSSQLVPPPISN